MIIACNNNTYVFPLNLPNKVINMFKGVLKQRAFTMFRESTAERLKLLLEVLNGKPKSLPEITRLLGEDHTYTAKNDFLRLRKKLGFEIPSTKEVKRNKNNAVLVSYYYLTDEDKAKASTINLNAYTFTAIRQSRHQRVINMINNNFSVAEISHKLNTSEKAVSHIIKEIGIKPKSPLMHFGGL